MAFGSLFSSESRTDQNTEVSDRTFNVVGGSGGSTFANILPEIRLSPKVEKKSTNSTSLAFNLTDAGAVKAGETIALAGLTSANNAFTGALEVAQSSAEAGRQAVASALDVARDNSQAANPELARNTLILLGVGVLALAGMVIFVARR